MICYVRGQQPSQIAHGKKLNPSSTVQQTYRMSNGSYYKDFYYTAPWTGAYEIRLVATGSYWNLAHVYGTPMATFYSANSSVVGRWSATAGQQLRIYMYTHSSNKYKNNRYGTFEFKYVEQAYSRGQLLT